MYNIARVTLKASTIPGGNSAHSPHTGEHSIVFWLSKNPCEQAFTVILITVEPFINSSPGNTYIKLVG